MRTREDRAADYWFYKNLHLCTQCHGKDAYTIGGRAYCADCTQKQKQYRDKWYETNRADDRARRKKKRDEWRLLGRCTKCGADLSPGSVYKSCAKCRAQYRRAARKVTEARTGWVTGLRWDRPDCPKCGRPSKKGLNAEGKPYRLCDRCWDDAMKGLSKTAYGRKEGHPWIGDNRIIFPKRNG